MWRGASFLCVYITIYRESTKTSHPSEYKQGLSYTPPIHVIVEVCTVKVVSNKKQGVSARLLLLFMRMGHRRSRFFLFFRRLFFNVFP